MELKSPPPPIVTIRRNPIRRARTTPSSAIHLGEPLSTSKPPTVSSFPLNDVLSIELPKNPNLTLESESIAGKPQSISPENLKVFLRIRPIAVQNTVKRVSDAKNVWPKVPKNKATTRPKVTRSSEVCVEVNEDRCSVTVATPQLMQESKRVKSEVYEGFSRVFRSESSQSDVYEEMVRPMVDDFLKGKSGMLAAMGPSGSGKTHTVFGSVREPGMVPLALRGIFDQKNSAGTQLSRKYFLSMMEINSEQGKSEKLIDLLHDGGDIYMQQSVVKGIQEAVVSDAQHAESLIARGMLKRATATTNSNSQSSRSQCVINIRSGEVDDNETSMLTIVDLAGAEKEKKTGNQGSRLLESNFINNTSMVFGLCLRSLLEHQKNRKKPLPKHYHNSLLTRYMRDYLEGKKRMTLILTVKPGMDDYAETSFLLKQASPFAKIKFKTDCSKRQIQAFPRAEQHKRMKFNNSEASLIDEGDNSRGLSTKDCKKISKETLKDGLNEKIKDDEDGSLIEIPVLSDESTVLDTKMDHGIQKVDKDREYQILLGVSKAFWTLLREGKREIEVLKAENQELKDTANNEKSRRMELENELRSEKTRLLGLERELKELNFQCTCRKTTRNMLPVSSHDASNLPNYQTVELEEVKSEVLSCYLKESDQITSEKKTDVSVMDATSPAVSCSGNSSDNRNAHQVTDASPDVSFSGRDEQNYHQESGHLSRSDDNAQDAPVDAECQDLSVCKNEDQNSNSCNGIESVDCEVSTQLSSEYLHTTQNCEKVRKIMVDEKLDERESVSNELNCPTSLECESISCSPDDENLRDAKGALAPRQSTETDDQHQFGSAAALSVTDTKSCAPPKKDGDSVHVEEERPIGKEDEVNEPNEAQDVKVKSRLVPKLSSGSKLQSATKPKRRLLPASSVLLKEMSLLDVSDENDMPKVAKGRKTLAADDKNRTQGSLSLLRLLKSELKY